MPLFNLAKTATIRGSKGVAETEPITTANEEFGGRLDHNMDNRLKNWPFTLDDEGDKSGDADDEGDADEDEIKTDQDLFLQRLKLQSKCALQEKLHHLEFEPLESRRHHQQATIDLAIKYLRDGLTDVQTWTSLSRDVRDKWNAQLRRELIKVRKTAAEHLMNSL